MYLGVILLIYCWRNSLHDPFYKAIRFAGLVKTTNVAGVAEAIPIDLSLAKFSARDFLRVCQDYNLE